MGVFIISIEQPESAHTKVLALITPASENAACINLGHKRNERTVHVERLTLANVIYGELQESRIAARPNLASPLPKDHGRG
jgi:hypothetical protein